MLDELTNTYGRFHESLITEISCQIVDFRSETGSKRNLNVYTQSYNLQKKVWERIKLIFIDVIKFNFFESTKINSTAIFEVYAKAADNLIVFDFFALQVDGKDLLDEDPNSTFVVHCRKVKFELTTLPLL